MEISVKYENQQLNSQTGQPKTVLGQNPLRHRFPHIDRDGESHEEGTLTFPREATLVLEKRLK